MIDHSAFIAAIKANPDVDEVRLVYADHLEEAGESDEPELIRVQCKLASHCEELPVIQAFRVTNRPAEQRLTISGGGFEHHIAGPRQIEFDVESRFDGQEMLKLGSNVEVTLGTRRTRGLKLVSSCVDAYGQVIIRSILISDGEVYDETRPTMPAKEYAGLRKREQELLQAMPQLLSVEPLEAVYERGFVDFVRTSWRRWLEQNERLLADWPLIREVELTTRPDNTAELVWWHRVEAIENVLGEMWPGIKFTVPAASPPENFIVAREFATVPNENIDGSGTRYYVFDGSEHATHLTAIRIQSDAQTIVRLFAERDSIGMLMSQWVLLPGESITMRLFRDFNRDTERLYITSTRGGNIRTTVMGITEGDDMMPWNQPVASVVQSGNNLVPFAHAYE